MSRRFKKHYTNYNREILKEFMTEKELNKLDERYNEAKKQRLITRINKGLNY